MKKKKIRILSLCLALLLVAGGTTGGLIYYKKTKNTSTTPSITVKKGQTLITAQINSINGNEITYAIATEMEASANTKESNDNNAQTGSNESDNQTPPDQAGTSENGQNAPPDMGEMPNQAGGFDQTSSDAQQPGGNGNPGQDFPSAQENSDSTSQNDASSNKDTNQNKSEDASKPSDHQEKSKTMYQLTGETNTTYIPVGTPVTTALGTTTTFSRLATGNMVQILLEENEDGESVIVGIWIL